MHRYPASALSNTEALPEWGPSQQPEEPPPTEARLLARQVAQMQHTAERRAAIAAPAQGGLLWRLSGARGHEPYEIGVHPRLIEPIGSLVRRVDRDKDEP